MASAPVALVTGGSGGLAPAIAAALAKVGHTIVLTARRAERLGAVATNLSARCEAVIDTQTSDVTNAASVAACVAAVLSRFGRIDVLINAAANSTPIGGAIEAVDVEALIGDFDTKVGGYLRFSQAVVPAMKRQGNGRIVHIGGLTGRSSDTLSGLRNAAVSHLTKVLSDQLGASGITVNAVHPGIVHTPHLDALFDDMARKEGSSATAIEARFRADIPTRRLLMPAEIGDAVVFLASAAAASITGQSITVDGGYSRGIYL
jgi:NAD(P)-dependent dehydrogenase (short-subunit alcohol dehydrogenase family)